MTDLRALLAPIRERLAAATPGPWEVIDFHEGFRRMEPLYGVVRVDPRKPVMAPDKQLTVQVEEGEREDAEFIANAPTDQAKLLAAIEAVTVIHTREVIATHEGYGEEAWCPYCCDHWPCDTVTALAAALGSDTTNQEGTQ